MLGKEAELEQDRLPSEETEYGHKGPMDEDTTYVLPAECRGMEKWIAVVDGIVVVHKTKSTALGTVVDLCHSFKELLLSMTQ